LKFDFLRVAAQGPVELRVLLAGRRAIAFAKCVDDAATKANVRVAKVLRAPHASLWAKCKQKQKRAAGRVEKYN
jgi:hypothetical protein